MGGEETRGEEGGRCEGRKGGKRRNSKAEMKGQRGERKGRKREKEGKEGRKRERKRRERERVRRETQGGEGRWEESNQNLYHLLCTINTW